MSFPGGMEQRGAVTALPALAKHGLMPQIQSTNTELDKLTKHTYQPLMFGASCPERLDKFRAPPRMWINGGGQTRVLMIGGGDRKEPGR